MIARLRHRGRRAWNRWRRFGQIAPRLSAHLLPRRGRIAMAFACTVGYMATRLLEPWPLKLVFDNVLLRQPLPDFLVPLLPAQSDETLALLYVLVAGIIAIALLGGVFYYFKRLIGATVGQELSADLRLELYGHLQKLSFSFHDRRRTGDLIVRLTNDVRMLREALVSLPLELMEHLLLTVGMLIVMLFMDWQLALIALLLLPGLAALVLKYRRPMKRAIREQRKREGHLATIASEVLGAVRLVQGLRRERDETRRFGNQNRRSLRTGLKAARLEAKFKWSADFAVAVVTALIVILAARRVLAGTLSPGDLIVFTSYLRIYARPLRRISRTTERMLRATAAGERVLDVLATESAIQDRPAAVAVKRVRGELQFEDLWFAYRRTDWVLRGIDLRVEAGEHVALVGPSGSGKTSLVSLVPRFYDPRKGCVRIDGRDVRDITLATLRKQISIVFQEPMLFATSIAENIAYGKRDAMPSEVQRAARRVGIHRVIAKLPQGYDTIVGERGATLSGGERQCVAIARALIRNAPLVILDEPTAGLDAESAALVLRALRRLVKGRTVITISHQLGSVQDADRLIVLDEGRVVGEGTRASLQASCGLYRDLEREAAGLVR